MSYYKGVATYGIKVLDMEAAPEPKKARTLLAKKLREKTEEANRAKRK